MGYGLEGAVPEALASRIIRKYLTPKFRQGDFFGGIRDSLQAITKLIDGEALPPPMCVDEGKSLPDFIFGGIMGFFIGAIAGFKVTMMFTLGFPTAVAVVVDLLVASSGIGRFSSGHGGWDHFPPMSS